MVLGDEMKEGKIFKSVILYRESYRVIQLRVWTHETSLTVCWSIYGPPAGTLDHSMASKNRKLTLDLQMPFTVCMLNDEPSMEPADLSTIFLFL